MKCQVHLSTPRREVPRGSEVKDIEVVRAPRLMVSQWTLRREVEQWLQCFLDGTAGEVRKVAVQMHFEAYNKLGFGFKWSQSFYSRAAKQAWTHMPAEG